MPCGPGSWGIGCNSIQSTRRDFITLVGGTAAAWPLAARAQQTERMRRIGVLAGQAESDHETQSWLAAFEAGLNDLGWTAGRNLQLNYRFAGGVLKWTQAFAKELVELKPDAILAGNTPAVVALMQESHTIPIVFANLNDPVDTGLMPSLARPGGNVTGFTAFEYSLAGKWLEILKATVPSITGSPFCSIRRRPLSPKNTFRHSPPRAPSLGWSRRRRPFTRLAKSNPPSLPRRASPEAASS
jgi:hypothetical protein